MKGKKVKQSKLMTADDNPVIETDEVEEQLEYSDEKEQEVNSLIPVKMFVITGIAHYAFITKDKFGFVHIDRAIPANLEKSIEQGDRSERGELKLKLVAHYEKVGKFRQTIKPVAFNTIFKDKTKKTVYWEIRKRYTALPVFELSIPEDFVAMLRVNTTFKELGIITSGDERIKGPFNGRFVRGFFCPNGLLIDISVPWFNLELLSKQ